MNKTYIFFLLFFMLVVCCFFDKYLVLRENLEKCDPDKSKVYDKCDKSGQEGKLREFKEKLEEVKRKWKPIFDEYIEYVKQHSENQKIIRDLECEFEITNCDKDDNEDKDGEMAGADGGEYGEPTSRRDDWEPSAVMD